MQPQARRFRQAAAHALADAELKQALLKVEKNFTAKRAEAVSRLPEFAALCSEARAIKDHTLAHLDLYLEAFERKVVAQGGQVHWCRTGREARQTILNLCRLVSARSCTKSKSMLSEEIALNPFLEANGVTPIETDLGEYILQLGGEAPSHIIGPAVHKTLAQIADLFRRHHGMGKKLDTPEALVAEARGLLRQKFLEADVGITGANFLIAETGSVVIVTNEGNADLTMTLPRMHIVLASIDKVLPTVEDACTLLRVLARSATGQEMSVYTTFATGTRRLGEHDGPEDFHVVLLDNGRSSLLAGESQELLRCIRCGACMNHCPVYQAVGGHAYGWVYPGPVGAALNPHMLGLEETRHLPQASSLCGRCEEVCPMQIPLPRILRYWRERAFEARLGPERERLAIALWAFIAARPRLYRRLARLLFGLLAIVGRRRGRFRWLPLAKGWTDFRDMPAPEGGTFVGLWRKAKRG
jgi:L-lactate dehydrogenase complex protein LldF